MQGSCRVVGRVKDGEQTAVKTIKSRNGDVRFLEVVLKCIAQQCTLRGLDLDKENNKTPVGQSSAPASWPAATLLTPEEQRQRLQRIAEKLGIGASLDANPQAEASQSAPQDEAPHDPETSA